MLHKQLRKIEKICRLLRDILTCLVRKHHTFQRRTFDAIPVIDYKNDFLDSVDAIMPPSLQKSNEDHVKDSWFRLVRRTAPSYFLALRKVGSAIDVQICANGCAGCAQSGACRDRCAGEAEHGEHKYDTLLGVRQQSLSCRSPHA